MLILPLPVFYQLARVGSLVRVNVIENPVCMTRKRRKVSPLMKPFLTAWREMGVLERFCGFKISLDIKCFV